MGRTSWVKLVGLGSAACAANAKARAAALPQIQRAN